jgi:transcriptional regulator with XRE-family HTH domain
MDHHIVAALRDRRKKLGLSKRAVQQGAGLVKATFYRRETDGRFAAIEQLERWAGFLGYRVVLVEVDKDEPIYWS